MSLDFEDPFCSVGVAFAVESKSASTSSEDIVSGLLVDRHPWTTFVKGMPAVESK
jgi:hypothetical protein